MFLYTGTLVCAECEGYVATNILRHYRRIYRCLGDHGIDVSDDEKSLIEAWPPTVTLSVPFLPHSINLDVSHAGVDVLSEGDLYVN